MDLVLAKLGFPGKLHERNVWRWCVRRGCRAGCVAWESARVRCSGSALENCGGDILLNTYNY